MKVILAKHYGMCFGVRDALRKTHDTAHRAPVTVLGELVHNEVVHENLRQLGVRQGHLRDLESATTPGVIITAHGAADRDRANWVARGHQVVDTTCPLVKKAHNALAQLVLGGYHPIVIGKRDHVEVLGLTGDFPETEVILSDEDIAALAPRDRFGVVSQTTQPVAFVETMVGQLQARFPQSEVRYVDTVCQPTKDRQVALKDLCDQVELVIVVGGSNSNNTQQLVMTAQSYGCGAYRVSRASELRQEWFRGIQCVGVTAGTSTLDETVNEVYEAVKLMNRRTGLAALASL